MPVGASQIHAVLLVAWRRRRIQGGHEQTVPDCGADEAADAIPPAGVPDRVQQDSEQAEQDAQEEVEVGTRQCEEVS